MANQVHVQNLRGNTAKNNNYLGKEGELVVNLDSNSLRIHDGSTLGGHGTVYSASSTTAVYAAMHDLAEGALVIVGTAKPYKLYQKVGTALVEKELSADVETIITKGTVKTEGKTGVLDIVKNSTNNYTINATFPEGGVYAAHTNDAAGTASILNDVEEGALIVEGTGPINVVADVLLSAETGNTLERKTDGLFNPRSAVVTADSVETASVLPNLAEGALIVEGPGDVVVETEAKVSTSSNNAIIHKGDGIFVDAVRFDVVDPGVGSPLPTGSVFLVYEV